MAILGTERECVFDDYYRPGDQAGRRTDQDVAMGGRFQTSLERLQLGQVGAQSIHFPVSGHQLAQFRSLFLAYRFATQGRC
jgi:hypothetical protein